MVLEALEQVNLRIRSLEHCIVSSVGTENGKEYQQGMVKAGWL